MDGLCEPLTEKATLMVKKLQARGAALSLTKEDA
jgi:hypothetical protein